MLNSIREGKYLWRRESIYIKLKDVEPVLLNSKLIYP